MKLFFVGVALILITLVAQPLAAETVSAEDDAAPPSASVAVAATADDEWPTISNDSGEDSETVACEGTECNQYMTCYTEIDIHNCFAYNSASAWCKVTPPIHGACLCSRC